MDLSPECRAPSARSWPRLHRDQRGAPLPRIVNAMTPSQTGRVPPFILAAIILLLGTVAGVVVVEAIGGRMDLRVPDDPFLHFGRIAPFFAEEAVNGVRYYRVVHRDLYRERHQAFPRQKPPGAFRVFCVGSSASAGWPHPAHENYSAYLQEALQGAYPDRRIEVLNVSAHGYAAYRIRMIFEEILVLNPDLIIIYTGNNEFVEKRTYRLGPHWFDPVEEAGKRLVLYRLVRGSRVGQWLFPDNTLPGYQRGHNAFHEWSKIERLVLDLRKNPQQLQRVKDHYAYSIETMVSRAAEQGVPVALLTVPVNLRDWRPNVSRQSLEGAAFEEWRERFRAGRAALLHGKLEAAVEGLREAVALAPQHAASHYFLGRALERQGNFPESHEHYSLARDLDLNPFRALSGFNEVLREIARGHPQSLLVDAERVFHAASAPYAPGFDMILDYVHATKRRNLMLAELVFNTIVQHNLLGGSPARQGFTHAPQPWSADGKPYDGLRDYEMQATLIALCMMMHQYETALEKAKAIVESPHGLAGLDEVKRRLVRGVYTIVPDILAVERRDLLGVTVPSEERAHAKHILQDFYRSVWGEMPR